MDIDKTNIVENNPENVYKIWSDFKVSPMGANLQIIFFKKEKSKNILVKFLHNEKEVAIPVKTDIYPFYRWEDVKRYYKAKLN
jgi:hypothetical protein